MRQRYVLQDFLDCLANYFNGKISKNPSAKNISELYWAIREFEINDMGEFAELLRTRTNFSQFNYCPSKLGKKTILPKGEKNLFVKNFPKKFARVYLFNDCKQFYLIDKALSGKNKVFKLLINRKTFGLPKEKNIYYGLINLVYASLKGSSSFEEFWKKYLEGLDLKIKKEPKLKKICFKISKKLLGIKKKAAGEICFIDTGFNGTFPLLCCALLEREVGIRSTFYLFSLWPWLSKTFKGHFYTKNYEKIRLLEGEIDE